MVPEVSNVEFGPTVLAVPGPVLVDFWGPRCALCLSLMPAVERLAQQYAGRLTVVRVNANANPRLCIAQKVLGLPTFILYHDGQERTRLTGDNVTLRAIDTLIAKACRDTGPKRVVRTLRPSEERGR